MGSGGVERLVEAPAVADHALEIGLPHERRADELAVLGVRGEADERDRYTDWRISPSPG